MRLKKQYTGYFQCLLTVDQFEILQGEVLYSVWK